MAFSFQNIKYGWVALAGITLTGTTIYIASNTRQQVQQIDVVEIVAGAYERCLATVYPEDADLSDNDKRYGTSPFEVIRNWVDSDGVTNIVTNAIGWTIDRELLVAVDSVIYDLIPHYLNTNFAATDMLSTVRLTVTGVWDTLQIGDKTNLFSRSPERILTNWVVNYTNHWPSTSTVTVVSEEVIQPAEDPPPEYTWSTNWSVEPRGEDNHEWITSSNWPYSSTNIGGAFYRIYRIDCTNYYPSTSTALRVSYTSDYERAVNYASDWQSIPNSSGTYTWVTVSNWPEVVITNAATYGGYPWRIYEEDLVERYKVLNLLKVLAYPIDPDSGGSPANRWWGTMLGVGLHGIGWSTYASVKADAYPFINGPGGGRPPACYSYAIYYSPPLYEGDGMYITWDMANYGTQSKFSWNGFPTNQLTSRPHSFTVEIRDSPSSAASPEYESGVGEDWVLILAATNSWEASHESITYGSSSGPGWPVRDPMTNVNTTITRGYTTITRTNLWWGMVPTNNIGQYVWSSNVVDNFDYCILDYDR